MKRIDEYRLASQLASAALVAVGGAALMVIGWKGWTKA